MSVLTNIEMKCFTYLVQCYLVFLIIYHYMCN
uniref:Uncharacterized protein n=1 Tax=Arundo donax TaxID=35708 RepID=A0A0A9H3J8_ARUDO